MALVILYEHPDGSDHLDRSVVHKGNGPVKLDLGGEPGSLYRLVDVIKDAPAAWGGTTDINVYREL